jgi:hypothetical protein
MDVLPLLSKCANMTFDRIEYPKIYLINEVWYSANMQLKPITLLCITNLTSNDLTMKIMWSSFIHGFIHFTHRYHALKTCLTYEHIGWYKVLSFISSYFAHQHIYPCAKCDFNTHTTYEPMNKQSSHNFHY